MATKNDDDMLLSEAVNDFLSRNRRIILSAIAIVAVLVIAVTVYFSFASKKRSDDLASVERILFDLNKEKEDIEKKQKEETEAKKKAEDEAGEDAIKVEEASANSDTEEKTEEKEKDGEKTSPEVLEKEDSAILKLEKLGGSATGYASYLAFYNIADMYFSRKDYSKAKDYYLKAYTALPNSYVAGILLFNVGVCIEEMKGELTDALEYYEKASKIEDFPIKPRAMLNVGRLQEKLEKFDDAIATYTDLFEKYPDNEFALIGKSRLIALNIKKGGV